MTTAAAWQVSSSVGSVALRGTTRHSVSKAVNAVTPVVILNRSLSRRDLSIARSAHLSSASLSSSEGLRARIDSQQSVQRREFGARVGSRTVAPMAASSAYDFSVKDIDGNETDLSKFKGKVSLIVNVASACGLTKQNYQELTTVYDKLKGKDFEVLAFPCNQFGGQEPGSAEEIKKFAGEKHKASYPLFSKVDVNGAKAEPLFQYLKKEAGGGDIAWNFGKFLVDKEGKVVKRFDPRTNPLAIEQEIEKIL